MLRSALLLFFAVAWLPAAAQDNVAQTFSSAESNHTTAPFTVKDSWEVRWPTQPAFFAITVLGTDGSVVAGTSALQEGSLYLPRGGTYSLRVLRNADQTTPWTISVVELGPAAPPGPAQLTANYAPTAPPLSAPTATNIVTAPVAPTMTAPPPILPTNAPTSAPTAAMLTEDQTHAVVVIKGDAGEGTGFLVHTADGPAVVTNLHVLAANPNAKILTTTGKEIKTLSLRGAFDRDLAMLMIHDDHYTYFELATDVQGTVQNGDEVITPGNSEGGEVVLDTRGTVLGLGPERLEISNPIYHGNSGGPVFHTKSGKVLGVVTMGQKMKPTDDLDKASFANANSAITGNMRYYSLRLDTVPKWDVYDWNRYLTETTFLKQFHDQSRCLDSFMNGTNYERSHLANGDENGPPDSRYWIRNGKLQSIHDNFHKLSTDADQSQKLDAIREEVMDLEGVADADMAAMEVPANFYSFDQTRAAQEVKYRRALRTEVLKYGDKISDMGH